MGSRGEKYLPFLSTCLQSHEDSVSTFMTKIQRSILLSTYPKHYTYIHTYDVSLHPQATLGSKNCYCSHFMDDRVKLRDVVICLMMSKW